MAGKSNGNASEGLGSSGDHPSLADAAETSGNSGVNGAGVIETQLAQMRAAQKTQAQLLQLEAKRQLAIRALQVEAESAQADFVAAMKSSDYEAVAKAARRMSRAETALVNLGYYD